MGLIDIVKTDRITWHITPENSRVVCYITPARNKVTDHVRPELSQLSDSPCKTSSVTPAAVTVMSHVVTTEREEK